MRLLQLGRYGELRLTEYLLDVIPPYAILSHIWGADSDEVTFTDLVDGSGKSKAGYAKIQFCAEQAIKDGLQYFWVDTCCINKASNAELSEAIISMFRWYRDAAKCYVYLSDVSVRLVDNNQTKRMWESAFQKSRWFTRCWTLQDLLAPRLVEFFSQEGERLGDKSSLEQQIHEITGIPIAALRGAPLSYFSVDERMRWVEKREAKKQEDKAYSLMGIFNVFMPLLYGEGENAMRRLKRGIEAAKDDDEIVSIATSSSQTLVGEVLAAADEFVRLLLQDQVLSPLLSRAFDHIEKDELERNIRRLLKVYASDLQQEAREDIEKEAVQLVLMRARYVAYRIRQRYDKSASDRADGFERLSDLNSDKRALLEDYLSSRARESRETRLSKSSVDDDSDGDASGPETPVEAESGHPELSDLDQVKVFMFDSASYYRFRQNLRDFVLPRREPKEHDSTSINLASFVSLDTWRRLQAKGVEAFHGLRMLLRPLVPSGYKRITWICGCGDHRYADVQEYRPNGASILQATLRRSVVATNSHGNSGGASKSPRPLTQAHLPGNSAANVSFHNIPPSGNVYTSGPSQSANATHTSAAGLSSAQSDHIFLLLCLTISGSSILEQVGIEDLGNDQYLWEKIRERYHELRGKTLWHQKLSMTKRLATIRWLSWLLTTTDLTTAHSIQFVRFQLVPIAMDIRPWNFHSPSLPPEAEVRVKRTYHYDPCPPVDVNPTGLNGELLHCLWKPGPHLDRFWLNLFPKKLGEILYYVSSKPEANIGWGIHVIEGVNWASVTFLGFVLVIISILLGVVYSAVTHDVGAAFSISAFLVVLPALGIALLQLRPAE